MDELEEHQYLIRLKALEDKMAKVSEGHEEMISLMGQIKVILEKVSAEVAPTLDKVMNSTMGKMMFGGKSNGS